LAGIKLLPIFFFRIREEKTGFTLIEVIIAVSLLSVIVLLIYPAYQSNSRSYDLSVVESSLQQNARLGMKKMVKELGAGMVVDRKNGDDTNSRDWISGNGDGGDDKKDKSEIEDTYNEKYPYFMIFFLPQDSDPAEQGGEIAFYAALPDDPHTSLQEDRWPLDPANHTFPPPFSANYDANLPDAPRLYGRRYNVTSSSWENPAPLISSDVQITQLSFILGGDNEDEILITLELAREGPSKEWRTYKLVSAVKLGAR
jgi:prepilin-type N-terminal cleavage/methylation domain-containing protein